MHFPDFSHVSRMHGVLFTVAWPTANQIISFQPPKRSVSLTFPGNYKNATQRGM
jgi:hypothetical protein